MRAISRDWWRCMGEHGRKRAASIKRRTSPRCAGTYFPSSVSDERTRETIQEVWTKYQLLLEPHGAVAWRGYLDWLAAEAPGKGAGSDFGNRKPGEVFRRIEKDHWLFSRRAGGDGGRGTNARSFDTWMRIYEEFRSYLIEQHAGRRMANARQSNFMALIVQKYGGSSVATRSASRMWPSAWRSIARKATRLWWCIGHERGDG